MVRGDAFIRQEWVKFTTVFQERNTLVTFRKISLWWCAAVLLFPVPELCPWFFSFSFRQIPYILLVPSSWERKGNEIETGKRILGNCPHMLHSCIEKKQQQKSLGLSANLHVLKLGQAGFLTRAWSLTVLLTCLYHLTQGQDRKVVEMCSLKEGAGFVPEVKGPACLFARLETQPFQPVCQLNCLVSCFVYAIKPGSCIQCRLPEGTGTTEWAALNPVLKLHQALEM